MDSQLLAPTDVVLPRFGFGTTPLGNLYASITEDVASATVAAAWNGGLRYFDTAPHYGVGLAEERLSPLLSSQDRSSFVISTKVGRLLRPLRSGELPDPQCYFDAPARAREWDFTRSGIRASLESSLERLGLTSIDIAYLHDPDDHEREVYETGYEALAELRREGTVKLIGAGMNQTAMLTRFVRDFELDLVLCAGRYTLLDTSALDDLLPECVRRGTFVVMGGVFNSGLLANPVQGSPYDYQAAPLELVTRAQQLSGICADFDVPLKAVALQFPHGHPSVVSVLLSASSPQQVEENLAMTTHVIPHELWDELRRRGYLSEDTPTPHDAGTQL